MSFVYFFASSNCIPSETILPIVSYMLPSRYWGMTQQFLGYHRHNDMAVSLQKAFHYLGSLGIPVFNENDMKSECPGLGTDFTVS
jgi:hypothetical protein